MSPCVISTDRDRLDADAIHHYLARSYWAKDTPRDILEAAIVRCALVPA